MIFRVLQIAVPFVWFGAVAAISFMEAPLKFTAPGITLALGLGIGRIVFQTLNTVEIALLILTGVSIFFDRPRGKFPLYVFAVISVILTLETAWLLPVLDARAQQVIDGTAAPHSGAHVVYIVFDALKVILLLVLGVWLTKENLKLKV